MSTFVDSLFKISAGLAETGLLAANTAMRSMQVTVETLAGKKADRVTAAPVEGPQSIDVAISEFANRAARITRFTLVDQKDFGKALSEMSEAARFCFRFLDFTDPRNIIVPVQLPLSLGSLVAESTLRGLASFLVIGPAKYPKFIANTFEMFTEVQMYVSVQYDKVLAKYEERLRVEPNDAAARAEYGRVLIKCGRFDEAVQHLMIAAKDESVRGGALHECGVAHYRAGRFKEAVLCSSGAMSANPENERARIWLWQSAQKAGGYPPEVPEWQRMEMKVGYATPSVQFEDISVKAGLDKTSAGRGLAVFDFDNDGYLDVLISAAHAGCTLYKNNGDGTFSDVSVGSGLDSCVNGFAVTVGDYNNDGYEDVYVTRLGFFVGEGSLYRNNGDGTFTDVTKESGISAWGPAFAAGWVDYNCDGHLDLFVCNNLGGVFDRKTRNLLFHNNGDGTFTEVSEKVGLTTIWPTIGAAWGDYNNDGYPDVFLSNAMGRSQLFRNNGDGTFTEVSEQAGIVDLEIGSTTTWFDYNNDGLLDILQFTWSDHDDVVHTMRTGEAPPDGRPLRIYRNNGDGTFTFLNREIGVNGCWGTMSGNAGDFNNDGYLDLLLGNGSPRMDRIEPPVLLEFDGEKYRNITFAAGLPFTGKGHGGNFADLFGDGRLCALMATGGAYPGELLTTSCFRPKTLPGNYLNLRLKGTKSNRSAIGARVCLEAGGRKQIREVGGGTNFGCLPGEQHFGLGGIQHVSAVEIRWPSGLKQRFENLPVNKSIRIVEGNSAWEGVYKHEWDRIGELML
jgi:tetratricopeptide (TPR) repeat protein